MKRTGLGLIAVLLTLALFLGAGTVTGVTVAPQPAFAAIEAAPSFQTGTTAKYIFLFIGDGTGIAQRTAAELYLAAMKADGSRPEATKLLFNTFPAQGLHTTYDLTSVVPDSASTGTAIASGHKTISRAIGTDADGKAKYETIAEIAKKKGLKVGIITTTSIDHATPAAFYAHQPFRDDYYAIALELGKSNFDYLAGGGLLRPKGAKGDQPDALEAIKANGYTVVRNRADLDKLAPGAGKVLVMSSVLDVNSAVYYEIDRPKGDFTVADYTKKGIELLDNPNGFFMMVEGGKVDWACHANDAASAVQEVLGLEKAVGEAFKFYQQHPQETLIVVTADHETGGMTIGFATTQYEVFPDKLQNQKISNLEFDKAMAEFKKANPPDKAKFEDILPVIKDNFGLVVLSSDQRAALQAKAKNGDKEAIKQLGMALSDLELNMLKEAFQESLKEAKARATGEAAYLQYGGGEPLTRKLTMILSQKAGIGFTSFAHTGLPVPVSAIGVGSEQFNGFYDDTDIFKKLMRIAGFSSS